MPATGHVIALPRTHDELAEIRGDLAAHGIRSTIRDADPGTYLVEDTALHEDIHGLRNGLLLGLVLGALLGLVLVLVVPGLRDLPTIGRVLLVGGIALQGTMPTMMWTLGRSEHYDDDPEMLRQVEPGEELILVDSAPDEGRARHVLEHHHAVFLDEDHPHVLAA